MSAIPTITDASDQDYVLETREQPTDTCSYEDPSMSADYSDLTHHAEHVPCSTTCENVTSDSSANDIQDSESDYACSQSVSNQETLGIMNQTFPVFKKGLRVVG